jgi:hypothetical protein
MKAHENKIKKIEEEAPQKQARILIDLRLQAKLINYI